MNNFIKGFMIAFLTPFFCYTLTKSDQDLFKAIENSNYRAVNIARYHGASLNAVDETTGDTPAFFAIKKLLKTMLEAHDDCYMSSIVESKSLLIPARQTAFGFIGAVAAALSIGILSECFIDKNNKQPSVREQIKIASVFLGSLLGSLLCTSALDSYIDSCFHTNKIKSIANLIAIVEALLANHTLDKTYIHPQRNTDVKGLLDDIVHATPPSGTFNLVREWQYFGGEFIDYSYTLILDSTETVYLSDEAYIKYIKPVFEKIMAKTCIQ